MFIDKNSREELSKDKLSEALDLFKKARLMDKKKCVQDIIKIIDEKKAYTFTEPKKDSNFIAFGYYNYNEKLYDIMEIIQPDYDYLENLKKIKDKDITTLTMKELETYITRIIRGEKFTEGLIASCIDDGTFKNLLKQYLKLYEKSEFEEMKKETKHEFRMWLNILNQIITEKKSYGEKVNLGAKDDEISAFCNEVKIIFNANIPQGYIKFLKNINGLDFNSYVIYGIDQKFLQTLPNQIIHGFIQHNKIFHEDSRFKNYFFLGSSGISWYVYDYVLNKFLELDSPSGEVADEFNDFELLLEKILGEAIA